MPSRRALLAALGAAGAAGAVGAARVAGVRRPVGLSDAEWHRGAYDRQRTGNGRERDAPGPGLTRRWATDVPDDAHSSSPILVDGSVHVVAAVPSTRAGDRPRPVRFLRLDAASGAVELDSLVTRHESPGTSDAVAWDSLVYADGTFYLLAFDGVHALAPDGTERWHRPLGGAPSNSNLATAHPVVVDGSVYAPTASTTWHTDASEGLYALDAATGDVRWRYEVPNDVRGWTFAPSYADGTLYCSVLDLGVVALDTADGTVQWERRVPVTGPPTVGEGRVFASVEPSDSDRSGVVGLDMGTGKPDWRTEADGTWLGRSVATAGGLVFHRERLSDIVCREAATGEERWRHGLAFSGLGTPAIADGRVYALARPEEKGPSGLLAIDAESGDRVGFARTRYETGGDTSVALGGGLAFATSSYGVVQCFESCLAGAEGHCLH
ncbi:PQQ-binding-like beta-propeller repeat protein [Haloglomus salinum]|uniref:outer membrane protein assembly factor BamB family protein n=1 Tax=Haloglomus salinum TaxID=2962673 RepID=UPI0020C9E928|nr:PQQ-binding-like beta-propeller repeat protein [Haloglomus salinum]